MISQSEPFAESALGRLVWLGPGAGHALRGLLAAHARPVAQSRRSRSRSPSHWPSRAAPSLRWAADPDERHAATFCQQQRRPTGRAGYNGNNEFAFDAATRAVCQHGLK